jgi:hypothetical protein
MFCHSSHLLREEGLGPEAEEQGWAQAGQGLANQAHRNSTNWDNLQQFWPNKYQIKETFTTARWGVLHGASETRLIAVSRARQLSSCLRNTRVHGLGLRMNVSARGVPVDSEGKGGKEGALQRGHLCLAFEVERAAGAVFFVLFCLLLIVVSCF